MVKNYYMESISEAMRKIYIQKLRAVKISVSHFLLSWK